jgi:hypothetical protein
LRRFVHRRRLGNRDQQNLREVGIAQAWEQLTHGLRDGPLGS